MKIAECAERGKRRTEKKTARYVRRLFAQGDTDLAVLVGLIVTGMTTDDEVRSTIENEIGRNALIIDGSDFGITIMVKDTLQGEIIVEIDILVNEVGNMTVDAHQCTKTTTDATKENIVIPRNFPPQIMLGMSGKARIANAMAVVTALDCRDQPNP